MIVPKWAPALGAAALFAAASAPAWAEPPVHMRLQNQEIRIEQGARSGALTPGEAARLQHQQARIRREEAHMRAVHGGRLTLVDRERLQRRLNRASAAIEELKHNDAHGPGVAG